MADEHHHLDPTFYRTPRDAAEAPPEKLAYVATFSRPASQPDAIAVLDVDPDSARYGWWSASPNCRTSATNSTTSAGTPAQARCTPAAGMTTAAAGTWSSRGSARPGCTSWTPSRTRPPP